MALGIPGAFFTHFLLLPSRTQHSPVSPTSPLRYKIVSQNGQAPNYFHLPFLFHPNLHISWNFPSREIETLFFLELRTKPQQLSLLPPFFWNHKFNASANPVGSTFTILLCTYIKWVWNSGPLHFRFPPAQTLLPDISAGWHPSLYLGFYSNVTSIERLFLSSVGKVAYCFILHLLILLYFFRTFWLFVVLFSCLISPLTTMYIPTE